MTSGVRDESRSAYLRNLVHTAVHTTDHEGQLRVEGRRTVSELRSGAKEVEPLSRQPRFAFLRFLHVHWADLEGQQSRFRPSVTDPSGYQVSDPNRSDTWQATKAAHGPSVRQVTQELARFFFGNCALGVLEHGARFRRRDRVPIGRPLCRPRRRRVARRRRALGVGLTGDQHWQNDDCGTGCVHGRRG